MRSFVCLLAASLAALAQEPAAAFKQYCVACHGSANTSGGINLERLTADATMGPGFASWEKVAAALEEKRMPPRGLPQPSDSLRQQLIAHVRNGILDYARKHDGDPGRVTVRRLTGAEYTNAIQDLTGLELDLGGDLANDAVGGEGFTNFGDVQFMQDANLERYLEAAKSVANRAVIGAGPLEFFIDPGATGLELSAVDRIRRIYDANGFRTVSGEGGRPFGLERYGNAFYALWRFHHRQALGEPNLTLAEIARRESVSPRFAAHLWTVVNNPALGYPASEVATRWRAMPAPTADRTASLAAARKSATEVQQFLVTWPSWLFARGDLAAGGAGDERPLEFSDRSLKVSQSHTFTFVRGFRFGRGPALPPGGTAKVFFNAALVNPDRAARTPEVLIWRNAVVAFRNFANRPPATPTAANPVQPAKPVQPAQPAGQAQAATAGAARRFGIGPNEIKIPLRAVLTEESLARLKFGQSPDGTPLGPDDFASNGSVWFEVKLPADMNGFFLQVDASIGADRDQVFRITMSDREDGVTRGVPVWALVGHPESPGYAKWKANVIQFSQILPPNSHGEPTPADKDPIPEPFDNTYNVPEHDAFVTRVKYIRDDRFVVENIIDDATRKRLDFAWADLLTSFEYHDAYLALLAAHYNLDLKGRTIANTPLTAIETLPAQVRDTARKLRQEYDALQATQAAARRGHLEDTLRFASRAWRRPLTEREKASLRAFYDKTITGEKDHRAAIRAVIARVLVSPSFLYRFEPPTQLSSSQRLPANGLASRLSFFLWSSIPDDELVRASNAGELATPAGIRAQVTRMLADPKARRFSQEFFGQWLGFYQFDKYRGVDTSRFPEFTEDVRKGMYEEATSFFEHVVRRNLPVNDIFRADYTYLTGPLAKFYGVKQEIKSTTQPELVEGANAFGRGGLLRLGAVLTATSAPLRTSPVKRGDWLLRRVLGTPVPPPPADAGSIPADDKQFGGLSLREKLESHKRNATCANCHNRIDPLGFPLERYDSTGRLRAAYADGKPVDDVAEMAGNRRIAGVDGILDYLTTQENQVLRTLSRKLTGYALGRTVQASDHLLIERMAALGAKATFADLAAEIATSPQFVNRPRAGAPAVALNRRPER